MRQISLLIIAGGKSSRLGEDKRFVEVGGETLIEKILKKSAAEKFAEIFLCVEENFSEIEMLAEKYHAKILVDEIKNCGPLSAISSGLQKIKNSWALAVSIDQPFFEFEILEPLIKNFSKNLAVIPEVGGKFQMLSAFYHKSAGEIFLQEILSGRRKIFDAVKKIPHEFIKLNCDEKFFNVNTQADLKLARGRAENLSRKIPVISIVADCSGTGKTTFIEKILQNLDLKIGVAKSTHHRIFAEDFSKDSYRFKQAGAKKIYVGEDIFDAVKNFLDVDLILTESRTKKFFPAVEIFRDERKIFDEKVVAAFSSEEIFNNVDYAIKIIKFLAGKS